MEYSIKLHTCTIKLGCSIVQIEGLNLYFPKNIVFLTLKIDFVLKQTVQTLIKAAFYLSLQSLSNFLFKGFTVFKGWLRDTVCYLHVFKIIAFLGFSTFTLRMKILFRSCLILI